MCLICGKECPPTYQFGSVSSTRLRPRLHAFTFAVLQQTFFNIMNYIQQKIKQSYIGKMHYILKTCKGNVACKINKLGALATYTNNSK